MRSKYLRLLQDELTENVAFSSSIPKWKKILAYIKVETIEGGSVRRAEYRIPNAATHPIESEALATCYLVERLIPKSQ